MPSFRIHPAEVSNPDQGAATEVPGKYTADDQKPNKVVVLLSRIVGVTPYAPSMLTNRSRFCLKHPQSKEYALYTKCVYSDYACNSFSGFVNACCRL